MLRRFYAWSMATRRRYIAVHGVLFWGFLTASLFAWMQHSSGRGVDPIVFVIFPIGGIFWGWGMWWWLGRMRAKLTKR